MGKTAVEEKGVAALFHADQTVRRAPGEHPGIVPEGDAAYVVPEPVIHGLFERVGVATDGGLVVSKHGVIGVDVDNPFFAYNLIIGSCFCYVSGQFGDPAAGAVVHLGRHIEHLGINHPDTDIDIEERRLLAEECTSEEEKGSNKPFHGVNLLTGIRHVNLS